VVEGGTGLEVGIEHAYFPLPVQVKHMT